jgi:hypothetical protein
MSSEPGTLVLAHAQGARRWFLRDRPLSGGDIVALCCSGGWITGRFEWGAGMDAQPFFFFSIELGEGKVSPQSLAIPEGALLRWA